MVDECGVKQGMTGLIAVKRFQTTRTPSNSVLENQPAAHPSFLAQDNIFTGWLDELTFMQDSVAQATLRNVLPAC